MKNYVEEENEVDAYNDESLEDIESISEDSEDSSDQSYQSLGNNLSILNDNQAVIVPNNIMDMTTLAMYMK